MAKNIVFGISNARLPYVVERFIGEKKSAFKRQKKSKAFVRKKLIGALDERFGEEIRQRYERKI